MDQHSSIETRSSRKRSREVNWDSVLNELDIQEDVKMKLAKATVFTIIPTEKLLNIGDEEFEFNLQHYGLTGWTDKVKETIHSLLGMKALPSPSDMKPEDIRRILAGKLPVASKGFSVTEDSSVEAYMASFNKYFRNHTEMEAMARIVRLLHLACEKSNVDGIYVQLQPSILGHSTFTDAFILINDSNQTPRAIIEVKRGELSCTLSLETKQSAQVLREAHILLCDNRDSDFRIDTLSIVLTNSSSWSFGLVKKSSFKIVLEKTMDMVNDNSGALGALVELLKGNFPV